MTELRTTTVFAPGDIVEVTSTDTGSLGPTTVRVLAVDTLGILGNVAISQHLPPANPEHPADYLALDATHVSVFPWAQIVEAHRALTGHAYEKMWRNAEARWNAARA